MDYQEELVVKRSKWGEIKLYDSETQRFCILGRYLLSYGVKPWEMAGIGSPAQLFNSIGYVQTHIPLAVECNEEERKDELEYKDSPFATCAIKINDRETAHATEREQKLIELFAAQGCKLTFVDE